MDLLEKHQRNQIQKFQEALKRVLSKTEAFDFGAFESSRDALQEEMSRLIIRWDNLYSQLVETEDDE